MNESDLKDSINLVLDDLKTFIKGGKSLYDWTDFLDKEKNVTLDELMKNEGFVLGDGYGIG